MHLSPSDNEKLLLSVAGVVARDRLDRGVRVLGRHRVVDAPTVLAQRATGIPTPFGAHRPELDDGGTILRYLADETHTPLPHAPWVALASRPERVPV